MLLTFPRSPRILPLMSNYEVLTIPSTLDDTFHLMPIGYPGRGTVHPLILHVSYTGLMISRRITLFEPVFTNIDII